MTDVLALNNKSGFVTYINRNCNILLVTFLMTAYFAL